MKINDMEVMKMITIGITQVNNELKDQMLAKKKISAFNGVKSKCNKFKNSEILHEDEPLLWIFLNGFNPSTKEDDQAF